MHYAADQTRKYGERPAAPTQLVQKISLERSKMFLYRQCIKRQMLRYTRGAVNVHAVVMVDASVTQSRRSTPTAYRSKTGHSQTHVKT